MGIEYDNTLTLSIQVSNWEQAKNWYQQTLGLTLQFEVPEIGWCEFETGIPGTTIGLNRVDKVNVSDAVIPTLGVTDIAAARQTLEAKGVSFLGETMEIEGMVKLANFTDPDGNHLCLAQNLAGTTTD